MFEKQPEGLQQRVKELANQAIQEANPTAWFDVLYSQSQGDVTQIPWAKLTVHPYLQDWLTINDIQGEGLSALVIGCGLGDDAEALADRGFQVTAFDISPTAIDWCQQRFPDSAVNYVVADLLALPLQWHQAFDLVVEIRNIQALPLNLRSTVIESVASVVAATRTLLVINRFRDTDIEPDGPPWPLSDSELAQFTELGLKEVSRVQFYEGERVDVPQLRLEYQKSLPPKV
ncbi:MULTISPECIES: class I SAM-dependent methyltransferase [Cyanophyceae]|uniref:class I SAM-dependent methyltransferase n=1 Tax=Cyanophyceae TaxID=3028117 RepID=UPI00232D1FF2|nr:MULTISPECIES: class I SAM-dependent methyltransferase [Cyanophyceae]MDB9357929.1 class I SAM-dependent methyltransferase [Nodularia spumigena CS-587/03]MDB9306577.1 class I SAM-dependent methyltransferase [Nodularia spumigena CS-591/12]MDB9320321.1 class I SAM-dependent methyltransferase [Nodularia spumigena CS-590/01A]MDB9322672.1 class I SAM-dependent methyltransferase [Nodularia spumigena CS-591/07A]MDB9326990.1 class I SAM-dependent methyltransferase [Nodularia spumigena CS-590/02]